MTSRLKLTLLWLLLGSIVTISQGCHTLSKQTPKQQEVTRHGLLKVEGIAVRDQQIEIPEYGMSLGEVLDRAAEKEVLEIRVDETGLVTFSEQSNRLVAGLVVSIDRKTEVIYFPLSMTLNGIANTIPVHDGDTIRVSQVGGTVFGVDTSTAESVGTPSVGGLVPISGGTVNQNVKNAWEAASADALNTLGTVESLQLVNAIQFTKLHGSRIHRLVVPMYLGRDSNDPTKMQVRKYLQRLNGTKIEDLLGSNNPNNDYSGSLGRFDKIEVTSFSVIPEFVQGKIRPELRNITERERKQFEQCKAKVESGRLANIVRPITLRTEPFTSACNATISSLSNR